jgi:hypothetical protein
MVLVALTSPTLTAWSQMHFFFGLRAGDFAESVGPAGAVAFVPNHPIQDHRTYGGSGEQIREINYYSHGRSL